MAAALVVLRFTPSNRGTIDFQARDRWRRIKRKSRKYADWGLAAPKDRRPQIAFFLSRFGQGSSLRCPMGSAGAESLVMRAFRSTTSLKDCVTMTACEGPHPRYLGGSGELSGTR